MYHRALMRHQPRYLNDRSSLHLGSLRAHTTTTTLRFVGGGSQGNADNSVRWREVIRLRENILASSPRLRWVMVAQPALSPTGIEREAVSDVTTSSSPKYHQLTILWLKIDPHDGPSNSLVHILRLNMLEIGVEVI